MDEEVNEEMQQAVVAEENLPGPSNVMNVPALSIMAVTKEVKPFETVEKQFGENFLEEPPNKVLLMEHNYSEIPNADRLPSIDELLVAGGLSHVQNLTNAGKLPSVVDLTSIGEMPNIVDLTNIGVIPNV